MKPGDLRRFKDRFNGEVFMILSEKQLGKDCYFDILIDGKVEKGWNSVTLERRSEVINETR